MQKNLKNYVICFLIAWQTILGCQAFANTTHWSIEEYVIFAEKSGKKESLFFEVEKNIRDYFISLLTKKGPDQFQKERSKLKELLELKTGSLSWFWMKKIDRKILVDYILEVTKKFTLLPRKHIAHRYRLAFKKLVKKDKLPLTWINRISYKGKSRGLFYHDNREISVDVLRPDEVIFPFVHELTHYFDKELRDARYSLYDMKKEIYGFYHIDHDDWNENQRKIFGRYWFLKTAYFPSLKEYWPRINACHTFVDLYKLKLLKDPAREDLDRYRQVIQNKSTCRQLTESELRKEFLAPDFFWSEGKWQYDLVYDYYLNWKSNSY